jgi:hypothetical protein
MAHSTMVTNTTTIPTRNMVSSQAPIGTPLSPRLTPTLPPRYHALNASIPVPTQVPSRTPGVSTPSGHNLVPGFILTLPRPPSRGSYPSPIEGINPSVMEPHSSEHDHSHRIFFCFSARRTLGLFYFPIEKYLPIDSLLLRDPPLLDLSEDQNS